MKFLKSWQICPMNMCNKRHPQAEKRPGRETGESEPSYRRSGNTFLEETIETD